jgi:hypothetical protein
MASLDALPAIIGNLPPVIAPAPAVAPAPAPAPASSSMPMLVLCAKELSATDQAIFAEFGNVVVWSDKFMNMDLSAITPFDYLICDMKSKNMRITLGRTNMLKYNVVSYVSVLQKCEDFVEQLNCKVLTSIPDHCVHKADFDQSLMNEKLISPSVIKSGLKMLLKCLSK